jgi:hypothetical protein
MLHSRFVGELEWESRPGNYFVRGVGGGSSGSVRVDLVELGAVTLARGVTYPKVRARRTPPAGPCWPLHAPAGPCAPLLAPAGPCWPLCALHCTRASALAVRVRGLDEPAGGGWDGAAAGRSRCPWSRLPARRATPEAPPARCERGAQVKCLVAGVGGLNLSQYSAGIICGDLMARSPMAVDLARKRIGLPRGTAELAAPPEQL